MAKVVLGRPPDSNVSRGHSWVVLRLGGVSLGQANVVRVARNEIVYTCPYPAVQRDSTFLGNSLTRAGSGNLAFRWSGKRVEPSEMLISGNDPMILVDRRTDVILQPPLIPDPRRGYGSRGPLIEGDLHALRTASLCRCDDGRRPLVRRAPGDP